jgi:hypothetical protein
MEELLRGQQEALIFAQAADRLLVEKFGFTATRRRQKKRGAAAGNANTEPIGLRSVRPSVAHQVCVVGDSRSPRKLALVEEKLGMFAPPSPAALAIFPNYDPKPNASARIAVLGKLPAAVT